MLLTDPDVSPGIEDALEIDGVTYAIGDVQGCFDDLLRLLDKINFDPDKDQLWFTGDLVNRGPNSLEILRFVKGLNSAAISVLGNHDLHLLAVAAGARKIRKKDTITDVLNAPDCEELLFWLRHQPLLQHDEDLGYTLIHAGLPPQWDLTQAQTCARELETMLQNSNYKEFLKRMYGAKPRRWRDDLQGWGRLRFIANCFTQMRYCDRDGSLDLQNNRKIKNKKKRLVPWFKAPNRATEGIPIIFGHWASLSPGRTNVPGVYPIDTGCAYGGRFTALRLQDGRYFQTRCYNSPFP
jgi:bis(5'-nucleosyl)-tetraphosphatase (symmetrical)